MKRLLDLTVIILLLPFILTVCLIISILVKIKLGSPIFFIQLRPGFNGQLFKIVKFRTMNTKNEHRFGLLNDSERLTKFGKLLRSSSLDELPEIWNVIKGEMSVVGPRPLLVEYLPLYNIKQYRRHEVLPGITGWAQINGRNSISWEDKFDLDLWYVDNQSILLDLKILFLTIKKVVLRDGINQDDHATTKLFQGNKK
jgi:lipopolysaccharide/colanic/teichoic acid biosynthesis glycosyltransferase